MGRSPGGSAAVRTCRLRLRRFAALLALVHHPPAPIRHGTGGRDGDQRHLRACSGHGVRPDLQRDPALLPSHPQPRLHHREAYGGLSDLHRFRAQERGAGAIHPPSVPLLAPRTTPGHCGHHHAHSAGRGSGSAPEYRLLHRIAGRTAWGGVLHAQLTAMAPRWTWNRSGMWRLSAGAGRPPDPGGEPDIGVDSGGRRRTGGGNRRQMVGTLLARHSRGHAPGHDAGRFGHRAITRIVSPGPTAVARQTGTSTPDG